MHIWIHISTHFLYACAQASMALQAPHISPGACMQPRVLHETGTAWLMDSVWLWLVLDVWCHTQKQDMMHRTWGWGCAIHLILFHLCNMQICGSVFRCGQEMWPVSAEDLFSTILGNYRKFNFMIQRWVYIFTHITQKSMSLNIALCISFNMGSWVETQRKWLCYAQTRQPPHFYCMN